MGDLTRLLMSTDGMDMDITPIDLVVVTVIDGGRITSMVAALPPMVYFTRVLPYYRIHRLAPGI